jgi:hypothetical protein
MKIPPAVWKSPLLRHALSLLLGIAIGVFCHYLLFRLTLPTQPFIYVAF